ncbi:MAG: phytoene synthase [Paludibacter sp. 47-17]|jgi:phytoene/squalene synthetase|nr:MAG: phytoene synthase [Paludibacter sp. SCN 50-10]OJX90279.1 MAG: phytoene synthase [Paludibacter sp. 47-17]
MQLYDRTTFESSRLIARNYSTSFFFSSNLLKKEDKEAIFAIYGFVRVADEIVDTFHQYNKQELLNEFEDQLKRAISQGISTNPVLHSFQLTIRRYNIPYSLIEAFMHSMRLDLEKTVYTSREETEEYVHGSANVVGLMCLKVFTNNNESEYNRLKMPAMKLGSAFQKVNFLRDLNADITGLNRIYFSNYDFERFDEQAKNALVKEIRDEFDEAYQGIRQLPGRSKLAVLTAYYYYMQLLKRIELTPPQQVMSARISVPNSMKFILLIKAMFVYKLKLI